MILLLALRSCYAVRLKRRELVCPTTTCCCCCYMCSCVLAALLVLFRLFDCDGDGILSRADLVFAFAALADVPVLLEVPRATMFTI